MSRITKDNDVSELQAEDDVIKDAVNNAMNSCIEEGIMKGYLEEHAEGVIETLMLQWDNELAMQARFEEGREEGIEFVALNMIRSGTEQIRDYIALNNAIACIPAKVNAKIKHGFDTDLYRKRNFVERFFQRIKNYRHIAIRYDKLAD